MSETKEVQSQQPVANKMEAKKPKPDDFFDALDAQFAQDTVESLAKNSEGIVNKANELRVNDPKAYEAFMTALKKAEGAKYIAKALEVIKNGDQTVRDEVLEGLLDAKQTGKAENLTNLIKEFKSDDMADIDKLRAKEALNTIAGDSSNKDLAKLAQYVLDGINK